MVATGLYPRSSRTKTEVLDLDNKNNLCNAPPFPIELSYTAGGAVNESTALICGGYDGAWDKKQCYKLQDGSYQSVVNLKVPRQLASSVFNDAQDLLVFGGFNSFDGSLKSIERVSLKNQYSEVIGELPFTFEYGCVLNIGQDVVLIGGRQNRYRSSSTWTSSIRDLNNWNQGPELQRKRSRHACAFLPSFNVGFVAGGKDGSRSASTELIDLTEQSVVQGENYSFKAQNI